MPDFYKSKHRSVGILLLSMTIIYYFFGLRPFNFSQPNNVYEIEDGLKFGPLGIAFTTKEIKNPDVTSLTVEFALAPHRKPGRNVPRIISFIDYEDEERIAIGQWKNSMIVRRYDLNKVEGRVPEVSGGPNLPTDEAVFVTIVSDKKQGSIFINGNYVRSSPVLGDLSSVIREGTRLVFGNGPAGTQPWKGVISTISLYSSKLPVSLVKEHFHRYQLGLSCYAENFDPFLYFRFGENDTENKFHEKEGDYGLIVPETFRSVKREFLVPIWEDFNFSVSYMRDIFINYFFFIPFGITAYLFFTGKGKGSKAAIFYAFSLGFLISLSIETAQIYLPGRSSQLSDLIFNSLGSLTGAVSYSLLHKHSFI